MKGPQSDFYFEILFPSSLRAPMAPKCHQCSTYSCSEGQLDVGGSVAQVGAATGPGDGVVNREDGACLVLTQGRFCAAFSVDVRQISTKF